MTRYTERKDPVLRAIARIVAGVILFNALSPLSVMAQDKGYVSPAAQRQLQQYAALNQKIERAKADKALSPADKVSEHLKAAQDLVASLKPVQQRAQAEQAKDLRAVGPNLRVEVQRSAVRLSPELLAERQARLKEHLAVIANGQGAVRSEFEATGRELQAKKLPAEILARHQEAVAQFDSRTAEFERLSTAWQRTPGDASLNALADFFDRYPAQRKAAPFDPKNLPWSTPQPGTRAPAEGKLAWHQQLWSDRQVRLAQAGNTSIGPISYSVPPEPGQEPQAADFAETDEVKLTLAIRAKAAELGKNPVQIYNWVRNNIEYVPTWGAIQSAQDTLDKKRGNATDTASLLIALLRASDIPARYQWGTIELGADKVQNWVGGVANPQAAQQLLGQGGIANRGIVDAGRISKIRLEHVWVLANVNWAPSRGAQQGNASQHVNPNGRLNAWVPLDASYKQYAYTQGMDLKTQVPLDAQALLNAAQQGATVNTAEGWVQNLNQGAIQSQFNDYQTRLKTYIDGQNPNVRLGEVVGKKIIPQEASPLLAGTPRYSLVQQSEAVQAVPAALQHRFTYKLYASQEDRANDSPLLSYTEKTSQLVGKRVTLTYLPATQADADTIASYLPKPHADGSPIQPDEFPTSFPGYLIKLRAQLTVNGQTAAVGSEGLVMGSDLYSVGGFSQLYDPNRWDLTGEESNVVGQATAIGISAGGISSAQLAQLRERLTSAQDKLRTRNLNDLTGEQIGGDALTANIWTWFALAESYSAMRQNQAGIVENIGLNYGLFHAIASPVYSWGVIRRVTFPGVNMVIGHVRTLTVDKHNDQGNWIRYNRFRGQDMSALEHSVPEWFFNNSAQCNILGEIPVSNLSECPQGISAVKALALAQQAGQKVLTITPVIYGKNHGIVGNLLSGHTGDTMSRVQIALDAGFEVTI